MSENSGHHDENQEIKKPKVKRELTRRQFLTYTLGGAGGFMAAGMIMPMLRFAVDPLLQSKKSSDWIKVVEESKISLEPQSFDFEVIQVDGWYESQPKLVAWISKGDDGKIFALNPTCKHLGCVVNWNDNPTYKNQYYCPCHGAHYTKDGETLAVSPLPLDEYDVKVENGFVYVGPIRANTRVN
jgi:menaquinol-cytochrome c reductase iron-sulfur subunit